MTNLNTVDNKKEQGLFIAIESVDPYDSSLYSGLVHTWLQHELKLKTLHLKDPHGNIIESENVYNIAKNFKSFEYFELFLFEFILRRTYINKVVSPAIKNGVYVVVNGYVENTYADALVTGSILYKDIVKVDNMVLGNVPQPDIVFIIDTPFSKSYRRAAVNTDHKILSTYEKELRTVYNRKRTEILIRATAQSNTYIVIDGSDTELDIICTIKDLLSDKVGIVNSSTTVQNKIY